MLPGEAPVFVEQAQGVVVAWSLSGRLPGKAPRPLLGDGTLLKAAAAANEGVADPALAARLVRLGATKLAAGEQPKADVPRDGTYLGALFESIATLTVRVAAQAADARVYHLRDHGGRHEIDMVIEGDGGVLAVEVKLSGTITDADTRHLRWLRERIPGELIDGIVINTGPEAYRRGDGIAVVPLSLLGP